MYSISSILVWVGEDIHGMSKIALHISYGDEQFEDGYTMIKFILGGKKIDLTLGKTMLNIFENGNGKMIIKPEDVDDNDFLKEHLGLELWQLDDLQNIMSNGPYYAALEDLNYDLLDCRGLRINTIYEYVNGAQITSLRYNLEDMFGNTEIVKFEDVKGLLSESDLEEITRYQLEINEPEV